jgi:uncharacterized membrane protein YfcA
VSGFVSDAVELVLVLVVGFFTGVLSAMFGVGGAVVSTPAIRALGATPIEAVGSTLPSIIPSAISGSIRYHREGLLQARIVLWTALVGAVAAVGGALLVDVVPGDGHPLMVLTAGLLAFTAVRTGQSPRRPDPADAEEIDPSRDPDLLHAPAVTRAARLDWWRLALIGAAAGLLSGLLGIGGGILIVPAFVGWVRLPLKEAIGNSLACVGVLAVPGTIAHAALGHIDWAFALPLCVGVIPGAQLGAHLAISAPDRTLRIAVATVLGSIAVVYATSEIIELL